MQQKRKVEETDTSDETGKLLQMLLTVMSPDIGHQEKRRKIEQEYETDKG